jgi:hypothetical protein
MAPNVKRKVEGHDEGNPRNDQSMRELHEPSDFAAVLQGGTLRISQAADDLEVRGLRLRVHRQK